MIRMLSVVAVAAMLAGACGTSGPAARTLGPGEYALPSDPSLVLGPDATSPACGGVALDAVLSGSASDPRKVWLTDAETGRRRELVWPSAFSVRFGEGAAFDVLSASGRVAIVGGSHVSGACVAADSYWLDVVAQ